MASQPSNIGRYEVLDLIGRGGMGVVYRAKDPSLGRMVAIKVMTINQTESSDLLQRFYREAKATANLQHPNIVTVYELGEHEGSPYLVMQYLEGASLESIQRSGQELSLLQKIDIIVQTCHGLAYAHQSGVVHRDIKPGNIMVLRDGSVKIVDFGIARIGNTNFTRTGQFMGSLNYMSPEQLNDKLQIDQRTDVYSTGVVLYQILTGALPFEAEGTGATLMKILSEAPPPFSTYISGYPAEIETVALKALAKDREQRYSSADEFALDLSEVHNRLKREQIELHMQRAEVLLQQNNLSQANTELLEVLKFDKQYTKAATMLRALRKQIEKEQSAEQVRRLRDQAQEAFNREDFDPAIRYLDQALHFDTTNADLQQLRSTVLAAKAEIEQLRQTMQRAENAHRAGNLDVAKQAIEEVLARRPNDARVKSLYRIIQNELDSGMRQKRVETLLDAARKEMANHHYTAAFDLLKEAEKVDPNSPALRPVLEAFTAAREQAQRRRALEQLTRPIEEALNHKDHKSALALIAEGLKRFKGEPALLKLKDLAETQKRRAEAEAYVQEKIAAVHELLNSGNEAGALTVLQDALKKAPGDPYLESLVSVVQDRLAQEHEPRRGLNTDEADRTVRMWEDDGATRILGAGRFQPVAPSEDDDQLHVANEQPANPETKQKLENSLHLATEFLGNQLRKVLTFTGRKVPYLPAQTVLIGVGAFVCLGFAGLIAWRFWPVAPKAPHTVQVQIQTVPSGAALKINGEDRGSSGGKLELPPGDYQLEASLPGYESASTTISVKSGAPVVQEIVLHPLAQSLKIATPDLDDGRVSLDENPVGGLESGSLTLPNLSFGQHVLKITTARTGLDATIQFQTAPTALPVVSSDLSTHQLQVVVVSSGQGAAVVQSSLRGLPVQVDGTPEGQLADDGVRIPGLSQGVHELVLGNGATARKMSFEIAAGPALDAIVYSDRDVGSMLIVTGEDDVQVFLDGKAYKRKTQHGQLHIPNQKTIQHTVRVQKAGFKDPPAQTITLAKGQEQTLRFVMEPVPRSSTLIAEQMPPGAQVTLDDNTPLGVVGPDGTLSHDIPPGQHSLMFAVPGFSKKSIVRNFSAGETVRLSSADLQLKRLQGTLEVVAPDNMAVSIEQNGQVIHQFTGSTKLPLDEGTYTVVGRLPNGGSDSKTVVMPANGEARTVNLHVASGGMKNWESPESWTLKEGWYVHHGSGFVLYNSPSGPATFEFSLRLSHSHIPFAAGARQSWIVSYQDEHNYVEIQMDSKYFYRSEVVDGKRHDYPKIAHRIPHNSQIVSLKLEVQPTLLRHSYSLPGEAWQVLNSWDRGKPSEETSRAFTDGKFGFHVPQDRDIEMSNFVFYGSN